MKSLAITLLATLLAAQAVAQDAPNPCHQPVMPNSQSSDTVIKYFNKHMLEYKACIDKYVEEQRAIAKQTADPTKSNLAFAAAEAAQKEYNAMVDALNTQKPAED